MSLPTPITLGRVERLYRATRRIRELAAETAPPAAPLPRSTGSASILDQAPSAPAEAPEVAVVTPELVEDAAEAGLFIEMGAALFDLSDEAAAHLTVEEVAAVLPFSTAASRSLIEMALSFEID